MADLPFVCRPRMRPACWSSTTLLVKGWGIRPPSDGFIRPGRASSDPRRRAGPRRYRPVLKLGESRDRPRAPPRPAGILDGVATDGGQDASMESRSEHRFSWWQQGVLL